MAKVSIVINNYNYARFLHGAVESALAQTAESEVVVVDDGSTDGSKDLIRAFGDRILPVLKPNGGQGSAYNAGLAASSGEIVVFLDADDLVEPDLAARLVDAWSPDVALWQWQLRVIDEHGKVPAPEVLEPSCFGAAAATADLLREGWYRHPPGSGNAYSRQFLTGVMPMPEEHYRYWADLRLLYSLPFAGQRRVISGVGGSYRRHGSNHSAKSRRFSAARLKHRVETQVRRLEVIREFAPRYGYLVPSNLAEAAPFACLDRLALGWRLPWEYPLTGKAAFRLAGAGHRALRCTRTPIARQALYTSCLWAFALLSTFRTSLHRGRSK